MAAIHFWIHYLSACILAHKESHTIQDSCVGSTQGVPQPRHTEHICAGINITCAHTAKHHIIHKEQNICVCASLSVAYAFSMCAFWVQLFVLTCSCSYEIQLILLSMWGRKSLFTSVGQPWGTSHMKSVDQRVRHNERTCDGHVTTMLLHIEPPLQPCVHSSIVTIECFCNGYGRSQWYQPSGCYLAPSFRRVHNCGILLPGVNLYRWD